MGQRRSAQAAFGAVLAALAAPAAAQTTPVTTAPAACEDEIYRAFDFWAGAWDVFDAAGNKAGENSITVEEGGCLLVERWRGAAGTTGQSYNFYDPGSGQWRQLWVAPAAIIDYAGGIDAAGAMVLEGEIAYRNGTIFPFKGTWTLEKDGDVVQHFQQYNPETDEWDDWFVGRYVKKTETP